MDTAAPGPELADYTALLRRRWWVVAAGTAAGVVVATTALFLVPRSYTAETAVQVLPTGIAELTGERSGRTNGEVNLDTEAQVVRSAEVADTAVARLGTGEDVTEVRERVEVTVPPNSSVLEISYSAGSPEHAREGSTAFAEAYLDYRAEQVGGQIEGRLKALRADRDERYEELEELAERAASGTGATQLRAESRLTSVQDEISELNARINPLAALADSLDPGRIITAAVAPESPSSPIPHLWLGSGALLGLVLGLAVAYLVDRGDPRLHTVRELQRADAPALLLDLTGEGHGGGRIGLSSSGSRTGQAFNGLAHALGAALGEDGRTVVVTGASTGHAGTTVAANLAAALARTGADVLLVCADPDGTSATRVLNLPAGPGLAEVLADAADPTTLERRPAALPGVRVLLPGDDPSRAAELLQRETMTSLVGRLRADTRHVVIATAPMSERADAAALACVADAVLVVVELGHTHVADLTQGARRLDGSGTGLLGTVVLPRQAVSAPAAPSPAAPARSEPAGDDLPDATTNVGSDDADLASRR
ncbi:hypothetical protein GCM10027294_14290 [Marinactinospora endophytica]